jgi:hypothetical protein
MMYLENIMGTVAEHKPTKWLRYVSDTWTSKIVDISSPANSLRPTITFKMEVHDILLILDVLAVKRGRKLA